MISHYHNSGLRGQGLHSKLVPHLECNIDELPASGLHGSYDHYQRLMGMDNFKLARSNVRFNVTYRKHKASRNTLHDETGFETIKIWEGAYEA
jgi:hypothetical protein